MDILKYIYYVLLIASIVTLFSSRKGLPANIKWLMVLLPISLFTETLVDLLKNNNQPFTIVNRIYEVIEMTLLCTFYYFLFTNKLFKKITIASYLSFIIALSIFYWLNPAMLTARHFYDFCLECLIMCVLIVLFFIQMLQYKQPIDLKKYTAFWINAIHLIFFGGCLFMEGFYFYLVHKEPILAKQFLQIGYYLNLLLYASYTAIFICTRAIKKSY